MGFNRDSLIYTLMHTSQGFDEFMNLVIDEAVEVKQITKSNPEEKRRSLGKLVSGSLQ